MQTGVVDADCRPGQFDRQGASMKIAFLLLTSSLVIAASGAFAQGNTDACHNQYGSCMERCSTRPQAVQESCSNTCEASTNQCYRGMYGSRSQSHRPSSQHPIRLRLRSLWRATKPKSGSRPRQSRKEKEVTSAQGDAVGRGAGGAFVALSQAVRGCAQAHPQGDGPARQRCCLLAEDAGAERTFPKGRPVPSCRESFR